MGMIDVRQEGHAGEDTGHCMKCMQYVGLNIYGSLKAHLDNYGNPCVSSDDVDRKRLDEIHGVGYCPVCNKRAGYQSSGALKWHDNGHGSLCTGDISNQLPGGVDNNIDVNCVANRYAAEGSLENLGPLESLKMKKEMGIKTGAVRGSVWCEGCGRYISADETTGLPKPHNTRTGLCPQTAKNMYKCFVCGNMVRTGTLGRFIVHNVNGGEDSSAKLCSGSGRENTSFVPATRGGKGKKHGIAKHKCNVCGRYHSVNPDGTLFTHLRKTRLSDGTLISEECNGVVLKPIAENNNPNIVELVDLQDIENKIARSESLKREVKRLAKSLSLDEAQRIVSRSRGRHIHQEQPVRQEDFECFLDHETDEEEPETYPNEVVRQSKDGIISIW